MRQTFLTFLSTTLKFTFVLMGLTAFSACAPTRMQWENTFAGSGEDAFLVDDDFTCMTQWTQVGANWYTNVNGHLDQTLAVAREEQDGPYPVGTIVQVFPFEAMVKRGEGFSDAANDWEFFSIHDGTGQTIIEQRGPDIENAGGSCISCHGQAEARFDFVCEKGDAHGCKPLPGPAVFFGGLFADDRCD